VSSYKDNVGKIVLSNVVRMLQRLSLCLIEGDLHIDKEWNIRDKEKKGHNEPQN